jgi:NADH:ubiquinone reductase (H+-translocating)
MAYPHVVIVGGGFAGLYAARALADQPVRVTIVDRQNYHLFQPLLYQVATAGLSAGDIASPIRHLVSTAPNITVHLAEVAQIDLTARTLTLNEASGDTEVLGYDFLMLAAGVRHSYFGHDEWEKFAPGLKSLDDALEIRRRVLLAFEAAETCEDPALRDALLTFVVVGGGPTGVELAGALGELSRFTVARDFRAIDPTRSKIILLEAGPRILSGFPEKLSTAAQHSLRSLGVDTRTNTAVLDIGPNGVQTAAGFLPARTVLWGAGVAASPLTKGLGVELDRAGRVKVETDLSIPGHPEAFVVGDLAAFPTEDGRGLPGVAQVAIQGGRFAARMILASLEKQPRQRFEYNDKGNMATIGRAEGIAHIGRIQLAGFLGWLGWLVVHLIFLIGFRNRLQVMLEWAWAWFTYQRGARLILGLTPPPAVLPAPKLPQPAAPRQ